MTIRATTEALAIVKSKRIVLISHDLSQTGSPLLLVETAVKLREAGAHVQLVTLGNDAHKDNCAARNNIEVLPTRASFEQCARADLAIANTAETWPWVNDYLKIYPQQGRSLLWWIHEIDAGSYATQMHSLSQVAMALFDSYASLKNWKETGLSFPSIARVIHPCVDDTFMEKAAKSRFAYPRTGIAKKFLGKTGSLSRGAVRKKLGIEPTDFVMTLIGTLPKKGAPFFLSTVSRMLAENPSLPIKVILVGFWSKQEGVTFLQGLNEPAQRVLDLNRAIAVVQDLTPYYAAADAFVMNSQGLGENFGRVTIEAMTFKLPVLGTNAGGTPEIVQHGVTGLLHPVGIDGQRQLAENILTLMKNPQKARAMGDAGYRRIQEGFTGVRFYAELGSLLATIPNRGRETTSNQLIRAVT
jgi:glycosyltransferase involved in cell wall biosynthesis